MQMTKDWLNHVRETRSMLLAFIMAYRQVSQESSAISLQVTLKVTLLVCRLCLRGVRLGASLPMGGPAAHVVIRAQRQVTTAVSNTLL